MKKLLSVATALILIACLSFSAMAIHVPSIKRRDPIIVPVPGKENVDAEIIDDAGRVIVDVATGDIILTPITKLYDRDNPQIRKQLEATYSELNGTDDLGNLIPELNGVANRIIPGRTAKDFEIMDVLNVFIEPGYEQYFKNGDYVRVTVDFGFDPSDPVPTMAFRDENGNWSVIPAEDVIKNADGTLTLILPGPGTLTLLKMPTGGTNPEEKSPQTGYDTFDYVLGFSIMGLAVASIVITCVKRRKRDAE